MRYLLLLVLFTSCVSIKKYKRDMRDYQIELDMNNVIIYDKKRIVGKFTHTNDSSWNNAYDSILLKDNL